MTSATARYLRISDDKLNDEHGVTNQDATTLALCERSGWTDAERYADNDLSATKGGPRPEYARLMDDIRNGLITRIVVFHLSRLWRNRTERAHAIELLRQRGVSIVCVKGPSLDLSSAYGRGMVAMLGEIDTMEVELKSERQQLAQQERAKAGRAAIGGPRAFGFVDSEHLDPVEAPWVRESFERWVAGATLGELCRWLNTAGVRTPRGNEWKSGSMRQMLTNPRYAGLRGVKWMTTTPDGKPKRMRYHEVVSEAVWPAIVEEPVWRAALARLQDPARGATYAGRERKYLLPGLAVCAQCGTKMKSAANNWGRARGAVRSLKCPSTRHAHRLAAPIEEYVVDAVCQRFRHPQAARLLRPAQAGVDLRALGEEAQAIRARLRQVAADEVLGHRSRDEVVAARTAASARLAEIEAVTAEAGRVDVLAPFVAARDPYEVWGESPLSVQRAVVDALAVIRVGSGRVGRPPKGSVGEPPPNVVVEWRVAL